MKRAMPLAILAATFLTLSIGPAFCSETGTLLAQLGRLRLSEEGRRHTELLARLERGVRVYDSLENYRAVFYKSERSGNRLEPREQIFLKFEKPFKVFMHWLNTGEKGLEVVYEKGKHKGKLAIHKPGLLFRLKPVIFLDLDNPWVRKGSASYDIEDVGIGNFLYDLCDAVIYAVQKKKLETRMIGDAIEMVFQGPKEDPMYFAHRVIVSFDERSGLPTRMALYDWDGLTMGLYAYEHLVVDVGHSDREFESLINPRLYKVYRGVE